MGIRCRFQIRCFLLLSIFSLVSSSIWARIASENGNLELATSMTANGARHFPPTFLSRSVLVLRGGNEPETSDSEESNEDKEEEGEEDADDTDELEDEEGDEDEDEEAESDSETDEEEDDEEDDEEEEDEEMVATDASVFAEVVLGYSKRGLVMLGKATVQSTKVLQRVIESALPEEGDADEDDEDEGDDDDDDDDEEEKEKALSSVIVAYSKKGLVLLGKTTLQATNAIQHAVESLLPVEVSSDSDDDDDDEDGDKDMLAVQSAVAVGKVLDYSKGGLKLLGKVVLKTAKLLQRTVVEKIMKGEVDYSDEDESSDVGEAGDDGDDGPAKSQATDFGTFLSKSYGVKDERDIIETRSPQFLGGSLADALETARSQARLLLILIPCNAPNKKPDSLDHQAVESILSQEVAKAANKRARKSGLETGSFLFWGAKAGSPEAVTAMKRLKVKATNSKGQKRPILVAAYPAQLMDSAKTKLVPRVLARHHCSPPPSSSVMAAWLNSLRKRHAKEYASMQNELKELEYYKERTEGYLESVVSDKKREKQEEEDEAKRLAEELEEKQRKEAIEKRREELKSSLPEESTEKDAKTIALRFPDGRSDKRRFGPDEKLSVIFNWIDGCFEIEREMLVLTTMNGKQTFSWDDEGIEERTLDEAGLGRSTGLRVAVKKPEDNKEESDEEDKEDSQ